MRVRDKWLVYECAACGTHSKTDYEKLDLDYELTGGGERSMGTENQYTAETDLYCTVCEHRIEARFEIWEYPVGIMNYTSVELDGAKVIRECYQYIDLHDEEPDFDFD
jgi:hypothetical protein